MSTESNWEELAAQLGAAQEIMEKSLSEMKARDELEIAERRANLAYQKLQAESMRCERERTDLYRRDVEGGEAYRAELLSIYREGFAAIADAVRRAK